MPRAANSLLSLGTLVLLVLAGCNGDSARKNVILITLDTTRADYLSSYGYERETTPNLDTLAQDGVLFERTVSASAVTPVSHASILSGLYPYEHGVRVISAASGFRLSKDTQTLTTVLKEKGYEVAAIHSALPVSDIWGFNQGFDVFESFDGEITHSEVPMRDPEGNPILDENGEPVMATRAALDVIANQRRSDETTDMVLSYLDRAEKPFFLWIHYWDPHDGGTQPPEEFLASDIMPRNPDGKVRIGTDEWYAEEIRFMDGQLGRLFEGLKARGLYDDVLMAVTADHGEGKSDGVKNHGWHAHRELYGEQINVPLIMKFPDGTAGVTKGLRVERLARTVDIFPTLLDYLDIGFRRSVHGTSLRDLVEGGNTRRTHYADQINGYDANARMVERRPQADFIYCAMDEDWKLIYRPTVPSKELYNIGVDPRELKDVAAEHPDKVAELMIELARHDGWVETEFSDEGAGLTDEERARLNEIGYVEGSFSGADWGWICPTGDPRIHDARGDCSHCGHPRVLIAKE